MDVNWSVLAAGVAIAAVWILFRISTRGRRSPLRGLLQREARVEQRGMGPRAITTLLKDVTAFASRQPDIRGVALMGAFARGAAMPGTDVDLVLLTDTPQRYEDTGTWLGAFDYVRRGHPVVSATRADEPLAMTFIIVLRGAPTLKMRFAPPALATARPPHGLVASAVADGLVIVHDPDGVIKDLQRVVLEDT
jgi:hypothetical protein